MCVMQLLTCVLPTLPSLMWVMRCGIAGLLLTVSWEEDVIAFAPHKQSALKKISATEHGLLRWPVLLSSAQLVYECDTHSSCSTLKGVLV
jgi:hypothetical protein